MARKRYQRGSVFLRGKFPVWIGRWREDVVTASGETRRVYRAEVLGTKRELPTAKLAQRRLDLVLARINAPSYRPGRTATVAEFAEKWKAAVLAQRKPSTILASKSHLKTHIIPVLGELALDRVGRETQQSFASYLVGKVSRKSAVNVLATLSAMLSTARDWGYISETVSLKSIALPERSSREVRCFTAAEAISVLDAAAQPLRSMVALAAMAGLRASEIMGLEVADIDFKAKAIRVRRSAWRGKIQTTKTRTSEAALPMPELLASILQEHVGKRKDGMLFTNRFGRIFVADRVVTKHLQPLLKKLGIPAGGFHGFRHLHSSLLVATGANPKVTQAQMRHADPRITLAVYTHIVGDAQREAVDKVAELLHPIAPNLPLATQRTQ